MLVILHCPPLSLLIIFILNLAQGHGFRSDLLQMLVDLKPSFIRFPGMHNVIFISSITCRFYFTFSYLRNYGFLIFEFVFCCFLWYFIRLCFSCYFLSWLHIPKLLMPYTINYKYMFCLSGYMDVFYLFRTVIWHFS